MWVKLGDDYLNLNQIVRVQFVREPDNKLVAFIETVNTDREVQTELGRYEGAVAEALRGALDRDTATPYRGQLP